MSLSAISSSAPAVTDVVPQKAPQPKAPAQPVVAASADTVSISAAAQKLQPGDIDHDGDSH